MFLEIFKKNENITHLCVTYLTWDSAKPIVTNQLFLKREKNDGS